MGIIVHPYQKQDFLNDKDALRRDELLLRLNQYQTIASPPLPTKEDLIMLNWNESSNNDKIDNYLLYSLYRNVVHLLITNDKSIIKKAKRIIHLKERVHTIDNFLAFLKKQISPTFETPAGINSVYLYNLDIKSHFFQSLRNEYNNFNTWFTKCCFENRKAWSVITNNNIHALCIYKIEEDECIADDTEKLHGKILKLCTFKVSEDLRGRKLGERLLFTSFKFAISNQLKYIYIYIHINSIKYNTLVELFEEYGFKFYGNYNNDDVYLKEMIKSPDMSISPLEYAKLYYPYFLDGETIKKFLIPIQNSYHEILFPDKSDRSQSLFKNLPEWYSSASNSIKKAYFCHSNITKINQGDLLFFFRTKDRHNIQCMGIVEYVIRSNDLDQTLSLVSKRTVFNLDNLQKILQQTSLIILFRYIDLNYQIDINTLSDNGIKGPIQTIREISHYQYSNLFVNDKNI